MVANAQQNAQFSQFMWTKLAQNPAYAGSADHLCLTALHRSQWVGLEGAPTTQSFSAHAPFFKERVGIGLNIIHDDITISNNWNIGMAYSYRMKMNTGTLSLGVQGTIKYIDVDWDETQALEIDDNAIPQFETQKYFPDMSAGVYYQTKKFYAGLSVQNLIKAKVNFDEGELIDVIRTDKRHIFAMGGYIFNLSDNVKLNPVFLVKYVRNAPLDIDLNASLIFYDKVWFGLSYRKDDSIDAILQYQASKQIKIGLAYDFTLSELQQVNRGTYEIMMQYCFHFNNNKIINIRFF